jgi:hypothetical protein
MKISVYYSLFFLLLLAIDQYPNTSMPGTTNMMILGIIFSIMSGIVLKLKLAAVKQRDLILAMFYLQPTLQDRSLLQKP